MSPPGRPKGEYRRAQPEGAPASPPGRPKGEYRRAQPEGAPASPPGRPKGEYRRAQPEGPPASQAASPPEGQTGLHRVFEVDPGAHDPLADLAATAGASIDERLHAPRRRRARLAAYAWLLLAIVAGVTGTSALSASEGFTRVRPIGVLVVAYLVCFLALTRALQVIAVGIAYAIWSGVGITLVTLIGWHAFDQKLHLGQLVGIALILVGVVVIQLFSRTRGGE